MGKRINSRAKGARCERELAKKFREHGYKEARRGQQFSGGNDSPDVVVSDEFPFHVECKAVQQLNLYDALAQSTRDAEGTKKTPIVVHKKNNKDWLVTLSFDEFMTLTDKLLDKDI